MSLGKTFTALALFVGSITLLACEPSSPAKSADDKTGDGKVDTSHIGEPPPVKEQDAPDVDFLIDMAGRSGRQALKCDTPDIKGPRDQATITVTFEPTGWSGEVVVQKPHEGTPMGECMRRSFEKVPGTNFKGAPVVLDQKIDFATKTIEKATQQGAAAPPRKGPKEEKKGGGGMY